MMKRTIYTFWTGGWDSTFRLIQLQKEHNEELLSIQPIYVSGDGRKSESKEIETMKKLTMMIREIGPNELRNLKIIDKSTIPADAEITDAFEKMRKIVKIGTQYEWLARLAKEYPGIEIGIEKPNGEYSGCIKAIEDTGKLIIKGNTYIIDKNNSNDICRLLFGNLSFPICNITEIDMVKAIHEWKCEDIMSNIWFCHKPFNDEPCGYCRPCQQKMECNMEWLIPEEGKKRYRFYKNFTNVLNNQIGDKAAKVLLQLDRYLVHSH